MDPIESDLLGSVDPNADPSPILQTFVGMPNPGSDEPEATLASTPRNLARAFPARAAPSYDARPHCSKSISLNKWNLKFDGHSCVRDFFVALDECILAYDVTEDYVVRRFHETLSGHALKYYRSIRNEKLSLSDIKSLFLSTFGLIDFDDTTEREIRNLKQKPNQPIREFLIEVRDLNSKLSRPIPDQALLPIIKYNIHPRYSLCLATNRISNLETLVEIATNFEAYDHSTLRAFSREQPSPKSPILASFSTSGCPKCGKTGHSYRSCPNVPGVICFQCKNPGFLTRDCPNCNKPSKN